MRECSRASLNASNPGIPLETPPAPARNRRDRGCRGDDRHRAARADRPSAPRDRAPDGGERVGAGRLPRSLCGADRVALAPAGAACRLAGTQGSSDRRVAARGGGLRGDCGLRITRPPDAGPRDPGRRIGGELDRGARARFRPRAAGPAWRGNRICFGGDRGGLDRRARAGRRDGRPALLCRPVPDRLRGLDHARPCRRRRASCRNASPPVADPGLGDDPGLDRIRDRSGGHRDDPRRGVRAGADRGGRAARFRLSPRSIQLGDRAAVRRVDSVRRGPRAARRPLGGSAGPARPRSRRTRPDGGVGAVARRSRRYAGGGSGARRVRRRIQPHVLRRGPLAGRGLR